MLRQGYEKLCELEREGIVTVIRPSKPIHISKLEKNPEKLQQIYELGKIDGISISFDYEVHHKC